MKFKEGKKYRITKIDCDSRERNNKYDAKFSHMTEHLVVFDKGDYKVSEIKSNYRRTWKVRAL